MLLVTPPFFLQGFWYRCTRATGKGDDAQLANVCFLHLGHMSGTSSRSAQQEAAVPTAAMPSFKSKHRELPQRGPQSDQEIVAVQRKCGCSDLVHLGPW